VNGIEKDLRGKAELLRLNILTPVGAEIAERYEVPGVPTLVVLAPGGEVVYRSTGMPDRAEVVARVAAISAR